MNSSKVLLGVLGGVAVGAVAGVLFAPAKGKETRKKILDNGKNYVGDLKTKFETLKSDVTEKYNGYVDDAKDMVSNGEKLVARNGK